MSESKELLKIKKEYGERFMHLCRELFPTLLENEGLLYKVLEMLFDKNSRKFLYDDIMDNYLEEAFKNFIYNQIDVESPELKILGDKTPFELLDEAGYDLYECTSEEDIQSFTKYYAEREELCTFRGGRLDRCVVFFAVKKNVDEIKRENFKEPKRDDEYGTSVISIQFTKKGMCTVSIKNRYNHSVNNPDATFGNDLNRIVPGLTQSFAKLLLERGLKLNSNNVEKFEIPKYTLANDGKMYRYNIEINQICYCPKNVIIEFGQPKQLENPESQMLVDNFVVDIKKKKVMLYDSKIRDSFIDDLQDLEKIEVHKNPDKETRNILLHKKGEEKPAIIEINDANQMVGYENDSVIKIGNFFLNDSVALTRLSLKNVVEIGNSFMFFNRTLRQAVMPNLMKIGNDFLSFNECMEELYLPKLLIYGKGFFRYNIRLAKSFRENIIKRNIKSQDIAGLDKSSNITTSELNSAKEQLENTNDKQLDESKDELN